MRPGFMVRQVGAQCQGGVLSVSRPRSALLRPVRRHWIERIREPPLQPVLGRSGGRLRGALGRLAGRSPGRSARFCAGPRPPVEQLLKQRDGPAALGRQLRVARQHQPRVVGRGGDQVAVRGRDRRGGRRESRSASAPAGSPPPRSSRSFSAIRKPSSVRRRMSSRVLAISRERRIVEQHAGALGLAAPDPAAQLVQLRQAEALGLLDHHDGRRRHVDARPRPPWSPPAPPAGRRRTRPSPGPSRRAGSLPCTRPTRAPKTLAQRRGARLGGGEVGVLRLRDQRADPERLGAGRRPRSSGARRSRRPATSARRGWRPACGRAASRRCARRRGRRRPSAPACAGSASPTWRSGARPRPWPAAASRSLTPKRCCSSITVSARAWKATSSWKSAWVPTATAAEPPASAASFSARPAPLSRPVSRTALIPWLASGAGQGLEVLARQDLGGRHQRRLQAGGGDVGHRQHGDHRLARADVALHQPAHPLAGRQVAADLGQRADLGAGQPERQVGLDRVGQRRWPAIAGGGLGSCGAALRWASASWWANSSSKARRRRRRGLRRQVGLALRVVQRLERRRARPGQRWRASQAASCHSGSAGARSSASSAKRRTLRDGRPAVAG